MISYIALIVFIITLVFLIIKFFKKDLFPFEIILISLLFLLLISEIIFRSILIKFLALTNTFESLYFYSALINIVLLIYLIIYKNNYSNTIIFLGVIIAFVLFLLASSPLASKEIKAPIPALQSNWLILHVSLSFIGEAFFAFSFAVSIYYLIVKDEESKKKADSLIYKSIFIGYPIFTAGALLFGAIWAQNAWGRFWGWDPKETFALITWLVYTIYLHLRLLTKTKVIITVLVSIIGFLLTLFTFFGVNLLLSGLHSYR